jgi:hypothetical protein
MNWRGDPLWRALAAMRIEPEGAVLGFAARLARENGWRAAHGEAVVEEYRRFLYLAATTGQVTPSEDVDQAWHLHLTYSRHYWDVLCGEILKRPLHHGPTEGGAAEDARYCAQDEATLSLYRATFGEEPPPVIWPAGVDRFAVRPLRIDASLYWLVPRALTGRTAGLAAASLLIAACAALAGNSGGGESSSMAIPIIALSAGIALLGLAAAAGRNSRRKKDGSGCGTGSSCGSDDNGGHHSSSDSGDGGGGCGGGCGGGD